MFAFFCYVNVMPRYEGFLESQERAEQDNMHLKTLRAQITNRKKS